MTYFGFREADHENHPTSHHHIRFRTLHARRVLHSSLALSDGENAGLGVWHNRGECSVLLGVVNLTQVNLPKIKNREDDWIYRAIMMGSMVIIMVIGFVEYKDRMNDGQVYKWLFDFVFIPLNATMFALLAFYIASAAFRAFRARNAEATVLLAAACVVMLARVPIGEQIPFIGEYLSHFMSWLMDVPNVSARRAIFVGAALGAIATGVRIILGIERSHLGGD